jgi:hypothetical protein
MTTIVGSGEPSVKQKSPAGIGQTLRRQARLGTAELATELGYQLCVIGNIPGLDVR